MAQEKRCSECDSTNLNDTGCETYCNNCGARQATGDEQ